ncbi:MAG: CopG family ribbon-helix-helix protein [Candidatus Hodarchaeota archaeon]
MFKIPIISISINEQLREFINKLVRKNQYENKSKLIRDALLRLMSTMEISNLESFGDITPSSKNIIGNLIIVAPLDTNVQRKLNKIESEYNDQIISKNQHFQGENVINFIIFEGEIQNFQEFVVEINGIKELKNFRYLIVN